jgi:protein kinase A
LIDKNGHIKLIDFGFSKQLNNIYKDKAYTNCGTPGYCAPEVMLDHGYTYKADVWSIGIMICEMLGGFTPFQNKNEASNPKIIMEKCRSGNLNLPKNLSGNSRDLIKLLITDDYNSRLEI